MAGWPWNPQFRYLDVERGLKAVVLTLQIRQGGLSLRKQFIDSRSVFIELNSSIGYFFSAPLQQATMLLFIER
ncbi:hypothetical protein ACYZTM_00385 [Pseudomonas sp. MDT2-39-1]